MNLPVKNSILILSVLLLLYSCKQPDQNREHINRPDSGNFFIGWSAVDITPDFPVLIWGARAAKIAEGIHDPITATVLAMESKDKSSPEKVLLISCDLVAIIDGTREPDMYFTPGNEDNLRDNVRALITRSIPEIKAEQIIINGTHTHTAPEYGSDTSSERMYGIKLDVKPHTFIQNFFAERIAKAAEEAWNNRKQGGISYGLGHAVVGHNRIQVDLSVKGTMYGNTNRPDFSHIEGFEDHTVNLLFTWGLDKELTGIVVNIACPAQSTEGRYDISADYWHDTREELRQRIGEDLYVLPQISSAGDQSPHVMVGNSAEERMQKLMFPDSDSGRGSIGRRKQIAVRIGDAVTSVIPYMKDVIVWDPIFIHEMETVNLSRRIIPVEDVNKAIEESEKYLEQYEKLLKEIKENPGIKEKSRWYTNVTLAFSQTYRGYSVKERYELQKVQPELPVEVHVIRLGDIVVATNPFELYLDYGVRIKARSPALQTFLVQLTGSGTYVPPSRSVEGGSYGAEPASTLVGPEGGHQLVEKTLEMIDRIMERN
jgi:hypothetical protein